jgi:hypothetical protein
MAILSACRERANSGASNVLNQAMMPLDQAISGAINFSYSPRANVFPTRVSRFYE